MPEQNWWSRFDLWSHTGNKTDRGGWCLHTGDQCRLDGAHQSQEPGGTHGRTEGAGGG